MASNSDGRGRGPGPGAAGGGGHGVRLVGVHQQDLAAVLRGHGRAAARPDARLSRHVRGPQRHRPALRELPRAPGRRPDGVAGRGGGDRGLPRPAPPLPRQEGRARRELHHRHGGRRRRARPRGGPANRGAGGEGGQRGGRDRPGGRAAALPPPHRARRVDGDRAAGPGALLGGLPPLGDPERGGAPPAAAARAQQRQVGARLRGGEAPGRQRPAPSARRTRR